MMNVTETAIIRQARGKFAAMVAAYFLGTFNDNFYKQAVMLLALAAGREKFQGAVGIAFTVPFILFAAPAGWMADHFPKRNVVITAKTLEVVAALVGAIGIFLGNLWIMVGMVAIMGTQSTFFSPALNGSIPELFPASYITKANAVLRMIVTIGILIGTAFSGFILDLKGEPLFGASWGSAVVGLSVIIYAALGLVVSLGIPTRAAADPGRAFPWTGPLNTILELIEIWKDHQLGRILVADVFIWSVGVFQLMVINSLGKLQFYLTASYTSLLLACQLIGLALGGLLSARYAKGSRWFKVLTPAGIAMGLLMLAIGGVPFLPANAQVPILFTLVGLAGMAGGLFLIPCESFIQVRPAPERKGAVWASANFASFSGMAAASVLYIPLTSLRPTLIYALLGIASLIFSTFMALEFRRREWAP